MAVTFSRKSLSILLQVAVLVVVYLGIQSYQKRDIRTDRLPELQGRLLDGSNSDTITRSGKAYVLHFWATWCRICRLEQSSIHAIAEDYPVLTIASQSGTAQNIQAYLQENNLKFPVLVDNTGSVAQQFGVRAFPTTFIVDGSGEVSFVEVGFTTEIGLRSRLALLN